MKKGVPYLIVYETNRSGVDMGKEAINLGAMKAINLAPCSKKLTSGGAKRINNLEQAVLRSNGYVITVKGEDEDGNTRKKDVYVMIGNIMDGELDKFYFPESVRNNDKLLDQEFVKSKY